MPLFPFLSFHETRIDVLSSLFTVTMGCSGAEMKIDTFGLEIFSHQMWISTVKVNPRSTLTLTRDLSCISSVSFTHAKLGESENPRVDFQCRVIFTCLRA